jgi:HPt (histidine-containing phosphotransfer) domain-containing protein
MIASPSFDARAGESNPPVDDAWSPPPVLVEAACGDDDLLAAIIDTFNTDSAARIQQCREALAAADYARIAREAHTIKGGARQVGADVVAEACQELETVAKRQEAPVIAARLNRVQEVFEEIRNTMASYSGRLSAPGAATPSS